MAAVELAIRDLDFEAAASLEGQPELRMVGSADGTIVAQLGSLVNDLHEKLVAAGVRELIVDIKRLEFMNATCFNVFVAWLNLILELTPEQRYQLRFRTNTSIPWQRRSLRTLSCFATDLVTVEE